MNRLARASGIAVSALTAATATVVLLVPGHARLEFPGAAGGASDGSSTGGATVTSGVLVPAVTGSPGGLARRRHAHGPTVSGTGSPSGLSEPGGQPAGRRSTGGHDALSAPSARPAFPPLSLHLPVVTSRPGLDGAIGDSSVRCLQGYVWRQAYAGDYVCVRPAARAQAAADNAAAPGRIDSGSATNGAVAPCQHGYVWRQVAPSDDVCVTPATHAQAAADNAQANSRVALLTLWVNDWTPPAQPRKNCPGGTCPATKGGWDGQDFQINGEHFNLGPVLLQVRRDDGTVLWSTTVTAISYPGFSGGALYAQTSFGDCTGAPGTTENDYAIAYDTVSGHWSDEVPLDSDCASR